MNQPSTEEIRALLKRHCISQEKAAGLVHVSLRAWQNWMSPNGRQMPLAVWELLLIKLGEHPDYGDRDEKR